MVEYIFNSNKKILICQCNSFNCGLHNNHNINIYSYPSLYHPYPKTIKSRLSVFKEKISFLLRIDCRSQSSTDYMSIAFTKIAKINKTSLIRTKKHCFFVRYHAIPPGGTGFNPDFMSTPPPMMLTYWEACLIRLTCLRRHRVQYILARKQQVERLTPADNRGIHRFT